jgi:hypothetical protein
MNTKTFRKATLLWLSLFLIVTAGLPAPALAQELSADDTVEEGEVLDQNLFQSGPLVVMDGVINGDLVAVGDEIRINGQVNGSLIAAGKKVFLNGPAAGSAAVSALDLELGPQADIGRDLYFIGGRLETQDASAIERDLNALSLEADLAGEVERETKALVGPLNLLQALAGYLRERGWLPQAQESGSQQLANGLKSRAAPGIASGLPWLSTAGLLVNGPAGGGLAWNAAPAIQEPPPEGSIDVPRLREWAVAFLRSLASLLIVGLIGIWLVPAQLNWAGEQARTGSWRTPLLGLLVFCFGWLIALLAFVLIILFALFLYYVLSLPSLGFLSGTMGLTALGLAVSIFWLSIAYFSKVIIAVLLGRLLYQRFRPGRAQSRFWPLLIGVALYALLASLPYLGWLVAVLFTLSGLGALWMVSFPRGLLAQKSAARPRPAGEGLDSSLVPEG